MARANKGYEIRPMVCDWALDIPMGDTTFVLYFNSRNNAELVKAVLEWEDAHPNEATSYQPTLTPPNEWVSADERLPENYTDVLCWYEYFRHGDYNRMYQTYGIGYCINGQWGGEVSNGTKCKVLYWQPMPAPPDRRPPGVSE